MKYLYIPLLFILAVVYTSYSLEFKKTFTKTEIKNNRFPASAENKPKQIDFVDKVKSCFK